MPRDRPPMRFMRVTNEKWPLGTELVFPLPPEGWNEMTKAEKAAWMQGHGQVEQIEASKACNEWTDEDSKPMSCSTSRSSRMDR